MVEEDRDITVWVQSQAALVLVDSIPSTWTSMTCLLPSLRNSSLSLRDCGQDPYGQLPKRKPPVSTPGQVWIHVKDYIQLMLDNFPVWLRFPPGPTDLHATDASSKLPLKEAPIFHTFAANGLFFAKAYPDIQLTISTLFTWVKEPNQDDWCKLLCSMVFLSETWDNKLIVQHPQTALPSFFGMWTLLLLSILTSKTAPLSMWLLVTAAMDLANNESTLTATHKASSLEWMACLHLFSGINCIRKPHQCHEVKHNILYQDNKSTTVS